MDVPSECELEVLTVTLFWNENAKLRNSRTYEHRQLKSHGNSLNCHGKVVELYYQISVGTL